MLQDLIQKLQDNHGLTEEQSHGVLGTVTSFIKEKFPMLKDTVENMLHEQPAVTVTTTVPAAADKTTDTIPAQPAEKNESFIEKAEEVFEGVKGKLGGLL